MESRDLLLACYEALSSGILDNMDQRWDVATADMLRSSMLHHTLIPSDITALDIYRILLPALDIGTTDTDKSPCSYQAPDLPALENEGIDTTKFEKDGGQNMVRTYLKMEVLYDETGKMTPTVLHWVNGKKFVIDRVTDVRHTANIKNGAGGGAGFRYTCMILGMERYLWFVEGKWFVEALT